MLHTWLFVVVGIGMFADAYADAKSQALRERKPLVVFVGQRERPVPNCVTCSVETFAGFRGVGVVIGIPTDGEMVRAHDLLDLPSVEAIRALATASQERPAGAAQETGARQPVYSSSPIVSASLPAAQLNGHALPRTVLPGFPILSRPAGVVQAAARPSAFRSQC